MIRKTPIAAAIVCVFLFVWIACAVGFAQGKTGTTGSVAFGYASARDSYGLNEGRNNPFTMLQLDHKGVVLDPRFLTYEVKPHFSSGIEDFYTGQKVGSGVGFSTRFLPNSPWPSWFSYDNFRSLFPSTSENNNSNHTSSMTLGGAFAVEGYPTISAQYERFGGTTNIYDLALPLYDDNGSGFALSGDYAIKGWILNGRLTTNNDSYNIPGETDIGLQGRDSNEKILNYTAQRNLGSATMFRVEGYVNRSQSFTGIVDSNFNSQQLRSYLRYHKEKIQASVQYDIAQFNNTQKLHLLYNDPEETTEVSSGKQTGHIVNSSVIYYIKPYLDILGDFGYSRAEQFQGLNYFGSASSFYAGPGISLRKSNTSWSVNAEYRLQLAPETLGHAASAGFTVGDPSAIRIGASYNWSRVRNDRGLPFGDNQQRQGGSVDLSKRTFGYIQLQVRGELQQRTLNTPRQNADDLMWGLRFAIQLPRVRLSYSSRVSSYDNWLYSAIHPLSMQPLAGAFASSTLFTQIDENGQLAFGDTPLKAHGQNLQFILSPPGANATPSYNELSIAGAAPDMLSQYSSGSVSNRILTASVAITRRMRLYGSWQLGSRKEELHIVDFNNEYSSDQRRVTFEWRMGKTTFEAIYNHYSFDSDSGPSFRKDIMVKVTRHFRIL